MKLAIALLLGINAWGQTATPQTTPTCPDGFVVNHIGDDPKLGWSCDRPSEPHIMPYVTPAPQEQKPTFGWSAVDSGTGIYAATIRTGGVANNDVMMTIHG